MGELFHNPGLVTSASEVALHRPQYPQFPYSYLYSVIAELTRVVKGAVTKSETKGKERDQPVHAGASNTTWASD